MTLLLHLLVFCALLGLAWAISLVLPEITAWPESAVTVASFAVLAGGVLVQALFAIRRQARRLERMADSLRRLTGRADRLEQAVETLSEAGRGEQDQSREMIQEMRVLQTLLGQIVGQSPGEARSGEQPSRRAANDGVEDAGAEPGADATALDAESVSAVLRGALSENRVDLYLQPTVALPSRRTMHYECFSRVRGEDGQIIYPKDYLPVAERAGFVGTLDNLLLFRCIQLVRKLGPRRPDTRFFTNISLASVQDQDFFPQFVEYMIANAELAERLVFEFAQSDFERLGDEERRRMASLGRAGYRFSIDQVASRQLDPKSLADQYVGYVKIDADILLHQDGEPSPRQLADRLDRHGLALIASKVEIESEVLDLLEIETGLGQGYLFGEPRPSREEPDAAAG